jgi:hypothetical protein
LTIFTVEKQSTIPASGIEIFNSTLSLLRQGWYVSSSSRKVELPPVKDVMAAKMYNQPLMSIVNPSKKLEAEVRVESKRGLFWKSKRIANFAIPNRTATVSVDGHGPIDLKCPNRIS